MNGPGPGPRALGDSAPARRACPLAVVLVAPEIPENLGFVARTMACYGLEDLRIADGKGMAQDPAAFRTASGGEGVLAKARSFPGLSAALADCILAFGFSRRPRHPSQAILDLSEAVNLGMAVAGAEGRRTPLAQAGKAQGMEGRACPPIALVFGCESQGLSREHALSISHLVRIPYADPVLSLNLSHAVAIAVHAFSSVPTAGPNPKGGVTDITSDPKATLGVSHRLLADLLVGLQAKGGGRPAKADAQVEHIRSLWQRLQPTEKEAEFLAGLIRKLV